MKPSPGPAAPGGPTRRQVLGSLVTAAGGLVLPRPALGRADARELIAATAKVPLVGAPYPETEVWCFGGTLPGPELRVRKGERLHVRVRNELREATTVHWHGLRLPNAMDGVPHLTQPPIEPGESFDYEFVCPDAGTFWYHPHQRSHEQVGRGLYGALIVEEDEPPAVDRDLVWLLDDWRLTPEAAISPDFGNMHDVTHAGRLGNTVTINGALPADLEVARGERIRLRLVNAANARIFALRFEGHAPRVIAIDGQPVEPHAPADGRVVLGPAMRVDLLLDCTAEGQDRFVIQDLFFPRQQYRLADILYTGATASGAHGDFAGLPTNSPPEPDVADAIRHEVTLGGGMMGTMAAAMVDGEMVDIRTMMHDGLAWAINGVAARGHVMEPMLELALGRSYLLEIRNDTAFHHPMHLHGHVFRVVSRDGEATPHREWQDTVLLAPRERAEIALVADNPGDWMFHCHVLEHQAGGMTGVVRVA